MQARRAVFIFWDAAFQQLFLDVQGVIDWLKKSLSLLLRLESNLLAKTGDILFFWLGHFDIKLPKNSIIIKKLSIFVAIGGEKLWKYAKYIEN